MNIKTQLIVKTDDHCDFEVKVNGKRQGVIRGQGKLPDFHTWRVPSDNVLLDRYTTKSKDDAIEECCRRNGRKIKRKDKVRG